MYAHVDLDVRERGRPERDHDLLRARRLGDAIGQREAPARMDAIQQLLRTRLLEGHATIAHGS